MPHPWQLNRAVCGYSEKEFCTSTISAPDEGTRMLTSMLLGLDGASEADLISPDQNGKLNVIPASELPKYAQTGDILSYIEPNDEPLSIDGTDFGKTVKAIKQRSWHADLAVKKDGMLHKCGIWLHLSGNNVTWVPCSETEALNPGRNQFHIFRPRAEAFPLFNEFEKQVQRWAEIYTPIVKPQNTSGTDWQFDPADIHNIGDLHEVARKLIRKQHDKTPVVLCVQWVYSVVALALCVPLNDEAMSELGLLDHWHKNWPEMARSGMGCPLATELPLLPYSLEDILKALALNFSSTQKAADGNIPELLEAASRINPSLADGLKKIPEYTILPIHPLWEYRNKRQSTRIDYEYIGTVFLDEKCERVS